MNNQNSLYANKEVISFLRSRLYIGVVFAIVFIAIDTVAGKLSWYWIFKWIDIPMHIAGGLLAGYFGILLSYVFVWINGKGLLSLDEIKTKSKVVLPAILLAVIVGISWELLEFYFGLSGLDPIRRADTIFDLFNDTFGGVLAIGVWKLMNLKSKLNIIKK